ncbi:3-deoxy-D-manno-octulosonic-acid transferase [Bernardetia litoralis DSM 6794]|uniref:3-deoxy-D-manno-octulosonic acid transferase n=1 Tax=Bernardetia litoralis (strain ATCC 23117 / DSM 6794 / NBRC 15988 / NCIMB 1366 / Fx l1 / Sio-4) TaxID=880071 RepID=I4AKQ2_BERLS|nr:glycosyltransferase N-terminal domain-containing protein [Bernardetia litoralis]AFM04537.1 3-deoxy-D-manno-octulosonic-acid transferase [Bernardetia litoralis DSM 6794]
MKSWLYDISLWGYWQGIKIAAPFNEKANLFKKGRQNWKTELRTKFEKIEQPVAWFHCASLGEFEQGRPVIEAFKEEYPDYKILLTFFSPSGYEIRKNYDKADTIMYLPLDTQKNAEFFVETVNPKIAFFIKYEFWHHFIEETAKRDIPLLSVSTIFRKDQHFFKGNKQGKQEKESNFSVKMLERFTYFFVQNKLSKDLLNSINISTVSIAGDTRFDRVAHIVSQRKELPILERFVEQNKLLVVGSSWQEDIEIIAPAFEKLKKSNLKCKVKLVIASHNISESDLQNIEKAFHFIKTMRYSKVNLKGQENIQDLQQADVLIIDNIGLLSSIYSYGDVAYIGGAFGKGLHNILEAATFGMPIIFGNKSYHKFQEATDLLEKKGAFTVSNAKELENLLNKLFTDSYFKEQINEITREYVIQNTGATTQVMDFCKTIL